MAIADTTDAAYERAFEAHWSDIFRFALAWTNDWTAAEDLAQEAFIRLWNHRAQLDWERPVLPWLLVWLGRPGSTGPGGFVPSDPPSATIVETPEPSDSPPPTPTPSTTPAPTPTATATPTPTAHATPPAAPTIGACAPSDLAARITMWEGAAGSRIADVEVTNTGSVACTLEKLERPQLIDGAGRILIDGATPTTRSVIALAPSGRATTLVDVGNYCGLAPVPPVRVAFVLRDGRRFIAAPLTPTDATVPPCNGPSQPGVIGMHPWAR